MSAFHFIRRKLSASYELPLNTSASWFLLTYSHILFKKARIALGLYDPLTQIASKYPTDKGVMIFPFLSYTRHYADLFEKIRHQELNILEIGLARRGIRNSAGYTCPSLEMWLEYFPNAKLYGFDIDDFSAVNLPRTTIVRGDQGKPEDLMRIIDICPKFNIIIDDGSHASFHQQITLKTLFPFVESQGLYIIEDLFYQPPIEKALPVKMKTIAVLKNSEALRFLAPDFIEVEFFDFVPEFSKYDGVNALAVIRKK